MYRIISTTDKKYIGKFILEPLQVKSEIILDDQYKMRIDDIKKSGSDIIISNQNYIIILQEV